jgi:hypothetical protein
MAEQFIELGWAEYHTLVAKGLLPPFVVMLYGPRDEHELDVTRVIVEAAYLAAGGAHDYADGIPLNATTGGFK